MREDSRFLNQFGCAGNKKLQHGRLTVLADFGEKSSLIAGGTEYPTKTNAIFFSRQAFSTSSTLVAAKTRNPAFSSTCLRTSARCGSRDATKTALCGERWPIGCFLRLVCFWIITTLLWCCTTARCKTACKVTEREMVGTWGLEPQTSTVSKDCSAGGLSGFSDLRVC